MQFGSQCNNHHLLVIEHGLKCVVWRLLAGFASCDARVDELIAVSLDFAHHVILEFADLHGQAEV